MTTMAGERACQRFHGTAPYFLSGLFAQLLRDDLNSPMKIIINRINYRCSNNGRLINFYRYR